MSWYIFQKGEKLLNKHEQLSDDDDDFIIIKTFKFSKNFKALPHKKQGSGHEKNDSKDNVVCEEDFLIPTVRTCESLAWEFIKTYSRDMDKCHVDLYINILMDIYTRLTFDQIHFNIDKSYTRDLDINAPIFKEIKKDFDTVLKGKRKRNLLENLSKLEAELSPSERDVLLLRRTNSKLSFKRKLELVFKVVILEVIRQGAVFIDKLAVPLLKALPPLLLNAAIINVVGFFSTLVTKIIPVIVGGTISMLKDAFRDKNILKGVPFFSFGLQPISLLVIAPALIARLFINYIKARVKNPIKVPKTRADIENEIVLMVTEQNPTKELLSDDPIESTVDVRQSK